MRLVKKLEGQALQYFYIGLNNISYSGAFSKVYTAVEKATGKTFAMKIVDKKQTGPGTMRQEIDIMHCLDHAHVVNLKEIFDTPTSYYVVLE